MSRMLWMVLVVWAAAAQTQIDLSTQAKNMPIKTGTTLPSTCTVGQIFFLTSAPQGTNLYGCTGVNTWSAEGGQPGANAMLQGTVASMPATCSVGQTYFATDAMAGANLYGCSAPNTWTSEGGSETVDSNGVTVGSRPTTNFLTGPGLLSVITDTGTEINIQTALDTAVIETLPGEQTGSSLLCASASGSASAYTCSMTPAATAYTVGMVLHWVPDVNGVGGPTTLNVDTLGAASVKLADGVSDPLAADIAAGSMRDVWYDGATFRFLGTGSGQTSGGGSGPVQSVFGRIGIVTAAPGDYTAQQVTGAATTNSSNAFTAGTQDFSKAAHTLPAVVANAVASLPSNCTVGELAFVSAAAPGQQIYECSAASTWTQQAGGGTAAAPAPVFNTYSNRPTCNGAATGTFFFASDISYKKWICDGTVWQPLAFDMQVVEPTALTWIGVSQGSDSPTIGDVAGAVQFSGTHAAGAAYEVQAMTAPIGIAAPYTIEVAFTYQLLTASPGVTSVFCGFGVAGGQTASGIWETMNWSPGGTYGAGSGISQCGSYPLSGGACSGSGGPTFGTGMAQPVIRAKVVDDGTTYRTFYYNTGSGYQQIAQQPRTLDIANPQYFGFMCNTYATGDQFQLTVYDANIHH